MNHKYLISFNNSLDRHLGKGFNTEIVTAHLVKGNVVSPIKASFKKEYPPVPEHVELLFLSDIPNQRYAALLSTGEAIAFYMNRYRRFETLSHFREKIDDYKEWSDVSDVREDIEKFAALVPDLSVPPKAYMPW